MSNNKNIDGKTRTRIIMIFYIIGFITAVTITILKTIELLMNK